MYVENVQNVLSIIVRKNFKRHSDMMTNNVNKNKILNFLISCIIKKIILKYVKT